MHISRQTSVFCVFAMLLLWAKIVIYFLGGELHIVSYSIWQWATNIAYLLRQDALVFLILIGWYARLQKQQHRWAKRRYAANILYAFLYIVDIWIYKLFLSRLAPSQYLTFLTTDTIAQFALYTLILAIAIGVCYAVLRLLYYRLQKAKRRYWIAVSTLSILLIILLLSALSNAKIDLYPYSQNLIPLQTRILRSTTNSSSDKHYTDYSIVAKGQNKQANIIVLFAESRSAIDSLRAWWLYNHFPNFDQIQEDGLTFTNFLAHGCTSDASHIAFLQWTEPWITTLSGSAYEKYKNHRWYLPAYFQNEGYNTQFFSTVSLDFLDQRSYIEKLWFDTIRGEESFEEFPTYVFDAASDTYLYEKTITQLQTSDKPLFFVLQNVSGHHPYNTPYGSTFQDAMRYSAASFATFYDALQENNFFDDGYLIVFSDHRKIAPLTREEFQHFGRSAYNRGVATIIWPDIQPNTFTDTPYQHIDFYHGLKLLINDGGVAIPSVTNDPFASYTGRDRSVRYCQYADPRYYITEQDGTTNIRTQSDNTAAKRYIAAYEQWHNQTRSITQANQTIPDILEETNITLVAHQWSPIDHPANSIVAMRQASEQWARGVEFDVSRTTDGYHVVVHGPDMGSIQCENIQKPYIYQYSFAELRADCTLSNGDAILTLSEMLEKLEWLFDYVFVDIKVYEESDALVQAQDIVAILQQFDRNQAIHPIAYNKTVANYLLDHSDQIAVGRDSYDFDLPSIHDSGIQSYLLGLQFIDQENYPAIQNSSIPVFAYTVRSYEDMAQVLDSGIRNILVADMNDAIAYINRYYQNP